MFNFTFDKRINMGQATNSILMIRPINFGYNEDTAKDNHYQIKDSIIKNSNESAQKEFDNMVENLKQKLIRRHPYVFDKSKKHTKEEQTAMWEKIKRAEKGGKDFTY